LKQCLVCWIFLQKFAAITQPNGDMAQISFFIDESGNPNFYAKRKRPLWIEPDFEPVLMLGMVVTHDRRALRKKVLVFQQEILDDALFNSIHSVSQPNWFLHACKDHSDVRLKFFEMLRKLDDVSCYVVIGRKNPEIFHSKHNGNATEFYFDLLNKLLTRFEYVPEADYGIYLSQRQSNTEKRFSDAVDKMLEKQNIRTEKHRFRCSIVQSKDFPELSVVDYLLWTLKRYLSKEEDKRYFKAMESKFVEIYDVYGNEGKGQIYNVFNPFDLSKTGVFGTK